MPKLPQVLQLTQGDITQQKVDAIVNAANSHLAGGGGVDGAIHRVGGPDIMKELKERYSGCPTGSAVITGAGKMKAKFVIHAVGPRWRDGDHGEAGVLASAYRSSLQLALEHQCRSVAFPSISTGAYGYPLTLAAEVAIRTVAEFFKKHPHFETLRFVLFDRETHRIYHEVLEKEKGQWV